MNIFQIVTPARVAAGCAYAMSILYPGVTPDLRAAIVGAVTGLYVLGVTAVEVAERKSGVSSPAPASATRSTSNTGNTGNQGRDIR